MRSHGKFRYWARCVNSNKPAGSGRSREIPRRVRQAWTLAAGWCALMFLIQVGRLNIALDFDTLWYGVRSQYIVRRNRAV